MMHKHRFGVLTAVVIALAGCVADQSPTAPPTAASSPLADAFSPQQQLSLLSLLPCTQSTAYTNSKLFGPAGGAMKIGPHTLYVPPGALTDTLTITGTAPVGLFVELDMAPAGHVFARSVRLGMSYANCSVADPLLLRVVYVSPSLDILSVQPGVVNTSTEQVAGWTRHFSSYMIAH